MFPLNALYAIMNIKKVIGFAFGPVATAAFGLAVVPLIAWSFDAEDVGRMNIFQISLSFVLLFSVLGLDQAYVREYHEAEDRGQLLLACFLPGFILLSIATIPTLLFSRELSLLLYSSNNPILYWVTVVAFYVNYFSRFLSLILRMEERGWAYSISQVWPKVIQLCLVLVITFLMVEREFIQLQFATLMSMLCVLLFYIWNTRLQLLGVKGKRVGLIGLKKLLRFGVPLIFSGLAFWGLTATSTVMLRILSSLDELAVYSVANSFASAAIIFQSIFTVIWAPTVYKWVAQGVNMKVLDGIAVQTLAVACIIMSLCGAFGWILDYFLPGEYLAVKYVFICILIQPLLYTLSEVTCVGIGIQRKTVLNIWITLLALAVNVGLSYYLIPLYGAFGAAVANGVAFVVFFVARTEVSARIWRDFPRFKVYVFSVLMLVLAVVSRWVGQIIGSWVNFIWFMILIFLIFYFLPQWRQILSLRAVESK